MKSELNNQAAETFFSISTIEQSFGLIGDEDLVERIRVLEFLLNPSRTSFDPRLFSFKNELSERDRNSFYATKEDVEKNVRIQIRNLENKNEPATLELLLHGLKKRWCFTLGDCDSYPSVPHGHLNDKNRAWPKLNPYTGRAMRSVGIEEVSYRLTRPEMIHLWNHKKFQQHALKQIAFYQRKYPFHGFPVPSNRTLKLPKWKQRT